jgi:hypothetical protein
MPLVEQHRDRRPAACEVCRFLETHPHLDRLLTHTLTSMAGQVLLEDLEALGGPRSLRAIYTEEYAGASPGRPAPLEPYHWLLALLAAPEVKLVLDRRGEEPA